MPLPTPELQAKWRRHFADNLHGTDREVDAATKAAMAALVRGEPDDRIRAAGFAAVTRLRGKTRPVTSPARNPAVPPSPAILHLDPEEWQGPSQSPTPHHPSRTAGPTGSKPGRSQQFSGPTSAVARAPLPKDPRTNRHQPQPAGGNPTQVKNAISTSIRGTARAVQQRTVGMQQSQKEILSFRVHQFDAAGNPLDPKPVELRAPLIGGGISGQVNEGDEVEVSGKWHKGTLRAAVIVNISTGAQIFGQSSAKMRKRILLTIAGVPVFFALFFGGFALFASCQQRQFDEHGVRMQQEGHKNYCESLQKNGMRLDAECREILGVG